MKPFKNKLAVTIVVLSVAFLGIIIFSLKSNSNIISSGAGSVISPLQKIIYSANDKLNGSLDFLINFSKVKQENKELTDKNAELENKLVEYHRMKDMIVITPAGLGGKGIKSEGNHSIVQTILNENIAVASMVESTRETTGILQGATSNKNKNLTILSNIPIESEIKEGDVILTSGLGTMYPQEIRIGEVVSVEVDSVGIMKKAVVKPYVDFNKLEELFIVIPKEEIGIRE